MEYVLIGGIAMNVHGLVRATEGVDLMLDPSEANLERLRIALSSIYHDPDIALLVASDLTGDYPVVRYVPPDDGPPVDLIARLGNAMAYEDLEWQVVEVGGVGVRVATPASLHAMKHGTLRPRDIDDARRLARAFDVKAEQDGEGR